MKSRFAQCLRSCSPIALLLCAWPLITQAEPIPVRYITGAIHGFLELRAQDGSVVAFGDITRVVNGNRITSRTLFHFKDGSMDDETTVFVQHRTFQLISDHHIQKGPYFPHPMDVLIDAHSGQITVRSTGKDGKEEVKTDHLVLPSDISNGLVPVVLENLRPNAPATTVSMVVLTPKPRLVKLIISNAGEDNYSLAGTARKATHYSVKIDLGGIIGVIAPLIGKAPPDIQIWTIGGDATTFAREQGPLYADGPIMTIQLASPVWPSGQ